MKKKKKKKEKKKIHYDLLTLAKQTSALYLKFYCKTVYQ